MYTERLPTHTEEREASQAGAEHWACDQTCSDHPIHVRMEENACLFDFDLDAEDPARLCSVSSPPTCRALQAQPGASGHAKVGGSDDASCPGDLQVAFSDSMNKAASAKSLRGP